MSMHQNSQPPAPRGQQEQDRSAPHPFRVGEMYANRRGNYEVMQITPPKMTIRYDDGELVTADIVILARIWDNMQLPPEQPETGTRSRAATRRPAAAPRAPRKAPSPKAADD